MLSISTNHNKSDASFCDSVFIGKSLQRYISDGISSADFWDFVIRYFCAAMIVATWAAFWMLSRAVLIARYIRPLAPSERATFANHILRVLFMRSLPKMSRIAAKTKVAGVANVQAVINLPVGDKEGNAMSVQNECLAAIEEIEKTISIAIGAQFPSPAITLRPLARRFVHITPKVFDLLRGEMRNVTISLSHRFENILSNLRLGLTGASTLVQPVLHYSKKRTV